MTKTDRQALVEIASMTLWGELIKDGEMRKTAIEAGEYDEDEGIYNPSADSECNMLRDAVETARQAIEREDVTAQIAQLLKALDWIQTEAAPPVHGSMDDMPTINAIWEVANKALSKHAPKNEVIA
ncbi:MAG TPA: hypothetical protein VHZ28_01250 [Terracidiphilus sp.]|jgi:hypothetical protein|nr:hypothetical protein [Terracidiphilus sp.]